MEQKVKFTCDGEQLYKALLEVTKEFKGRKWVYFKTCFAEQKLYLDNIVGIPCYDFSGDDVAFELWRGEIKKYIRIERGDKLRFEVEDLELQINTTSLVLSSMAQTFPVEPWANKKKSSCNPKGESTVMEKDDGNDGIKGKTKTKDSVEKQLREEIIKPYLDRIAELEKQLKEHIEEEQILLNMVYLEQQKSKDVIGAKEQYNKSESEVVEHKMFDDDERAALLAQLNDLPKERKRINKQLDDYVWKATKKMDQLKDQIKTLEKRLIVQKWVILVLGIGWIISIIYLLA